MNDGPKEACKTYVEQTKLLVTLASALVVAPAAMIPLFSGTSHLILSSGMIWKFVCAEVAFIISVLAGYIVLASIAGYQHKNIFNVYRGATRYLSLFQLFMYVAGLSLLGCILFSMLRQIPR